MVTKEQAIANAKYLIRRTGKRHYIYCINNFWRWTDKSKDSAQKTYTGKHAIMNYEEVRLNGVLYA